MVSILVLTLLFNVAFVSGDTYMHSLRGSNNRLHESTATRRNGNRMFDSQNNARGGYNVGDVDTARRGEQYDMKYFQSGPNYLTKKEGISTVPIEWTNQHGCGKNNGDDDPIKLNCNMVLQFMCDIRKAPTRNRNELKERMRNGRTTNTNGYTKPRKGESEARYIGRARRNNPSNGMNEPFEARDKCEARERNKGLFTADQKLKADKAVNTRQNPKGTRRGYECPEERDYYPYWHPSDWKDIAILTEDKSRCDDYKAKSFNFKPYHECVEKWPGSQKKKHYSAHNNEAACKSGGGDWTQFYNYLEVFSDKTTKTDCDNHGKKLGVKVQWGLRMHHHEDECLRLLEKPECDYAPYTRVNHLGNAASDADNLQTNTYNWKLPHFYDGLERNCVFRMRYNISTTDYNGTTTDSNSNKGNSPIKQNPLVDVGLPAKQKLRLAINTQQTGRTFQDRSHIFVIRPRGDKLGDKANIFNLNVRGKRGNIVQTFPAVEYDFAPNTLKVTKKDLIHIQWTGSNTHNNGGGGGDGQAGDAGEGQGGTDRTNLLSMKDESYNFFSTLEDKTGIAHNVHWVWAPNSIPNNSSTDLGVQLASAGYFRCYDCSSSESLKQKSRKMQNQLNNAPASYEGVVVRFTKSGTYPYGCSRNNNFSNRSQKGKFVVR